MNIYWLNRQNKRHFGLFNNEVELNQMVFEVRAEYALDLRKEKLNQKVSKLSPRRHKCDVEDFKKVLSDGSLFQDYEIDRIIDIVESGE